MHHGTVIILITEILHILIKDDIYEKKHIPYDSICYSVDFYDISVTYNIS